uniref:MFS domain-containing protein n=1 Tax=Meloidogyne hapla TaxID=6305 RepID=A0A1I8AXM4_MELHA
MVHQSFGDPSNLLLENLDADKVLLLFGKCGLYQGSDVLSTNSTVTNYYGKHISLADEADRYGRRMTFLLSLWLTTAMSFACAYSPTYNLFLVFRFLSGASGQAILIVGYVVTVESVATSFRSIQALINSLIWVNLLHIVLNFVYWVLTLHSVDMHENRMVGFFLSAAVEIPAGIIAMLLLMVFGRRTVTFLSVSGQTLSLGLTIITPR